MKSLLLVDDDRGVVDALRRVLRLKRPGWRIAAASGGQEALEKMAAQHFDLVLSDMQMPGIDGADLLRQVAELHPATIRIVLSGHSDDEASVRAAPWAHRFLSKPCEVAAVLAVIDEVLDPPVDVGGERVRALIAGTVALPSPPTVWQRLQRCVENPDATVGDIAAIVAEDPGVTSKLLQLVNSSFFGLGRRLSDIREAVIYLGPSTVKHLVLSFALELPSRTRLPFDLEAVRRHGIAAAVRTRQLVCREDEQDAFAAALIQDAGLLVLGLSTDADIVESLAAVSAGRLRLVDAERDVIGASHTAVGAHLLGLWGLPASVVEAVLTHHHAPVEFSPPLGCSDAVRVAHRTATDVDPLGADPFADADEARPEGEVERA